MLNFVVNQDLVFFPWLFSQENIHYPNFEQLCKQKEPFIFRPLLRGVTVTSTFSWPEPRSLPRHIFLVYLALPDTLGYRILTNALSGLCAEWGCVSSRTRVQRLAPDLPRFLSFALAILFLERACPDFIFSDGALRYYITLSCLGFLSVLGKG